MDQAGMTAHRLAAQSEGRISRRTAYRLSRGQKAGLYPEEIAALVDIFELKDVGDLFELRNAASRGK